MKHDPKALLSQAQVQLQTQPGVEPWRITDDDLERWAVQPARVDAAEHKRLCLDGVVMPETADDTLPCPVCAYHAAFAKLRLAMSNCGIEPRYLDATWDDLRTDVQPFPRLRTACERIEQMFASNTSLLLHGDHGFGKTQSSMLLARAALERGYSARIVNLGELCMSVRAGYDDKGDHLSEPEAVKLMSTPDLLILEDFGAAEADSGALEKRLLWSASNTRHNAHKPTIITSNLNPREVGKSMGGRIYARFQPLYTVAFTHGINFRVPDGAVTPWF